MGKGTDLRNSLPPRAGTKRNEALIAIIDAGQTVVEFGPLSWTHADGTFIELEVSLAPVAIGDEADPFWMPMTHPVSQHAADVLDCILATALIDDRSAAAAPVWVPPATGTPGESDTAAMGRHYDRVIASLAKLGYETPGSRRGVRIAGIGKTHCTSIKCEQRPDHCVINGFHSKTGPDESRFVPGVRGYQVGNKYGESAGHFLQFDHYPTGLPRVVKRACRIGGVDMDIGEALKDPALSHYLTGWPAGTALKHDRHPAVPRRAPKPMLVFESGEPQPWQDPAVTHGERAVAWTQHQRELGVKEVPPGSNTSKEIAEWFKPCVRRIDGVDVPIGITRGAWCIVTLFAAERAALIDGFDAPLPRSLVSGLELVEELIAREMFMPVTLALDGSFQLEAGDHVVLHRGGVDSWKRHGCRVVTPNRPGELNYWTIGGNEADQIRVTERRLDDPQLIGFGELPHQRRQARIAAAPAELNEHINHEAMAAAALIMEAVAKMVADFAALDRAEGFG